MKSLVFLFALCLAAPVSAQTGAVVSYRLDLFDATLDPFGQGTPLKSGTLASTDVVCNQVRPVVLMLTVFNPGRIFWNDPVNPDKVCLARTSVSQWWGNQKPPALIATVTVIDDRGLTSDRSAASFPIQIQPPAAVSGVRFVQ